MSLWTSVTLRVGMVCLGVGCAHGGNTRLPTLGVPDPAAERQSYRHHDPFPDEGAGPATSHRPRAFSQQRPEPRRAAEQRVLQGPPPQFVAPQYPPGASYVPPAGEYPQSLRY